MLKLVLRLIMIVIVRPIMAILFLFSSPERDITLEEAFPIPPQYDYCELSHWRREGKIDLTLRKRGSPWQNKNYVLHTGDLPRVQALVEADGFAPSRGHFGLTSGTSFVDQESSNYFYSRQ